MSGLGSWRHLVRRFFDVAGSGPLRPAEREEVDGWLDREAERALFWAQPVADQRHALQTARRVAAEVPVRRELIRAALFHDIGKRHARLGIIGRSMASLLAKLGLPMRGRFAAYLDHGRLGAGDLAAVGAEPLVCEFALHHHGGRPPSIDAGDWRILQRADH